jgi:outer membrane protein
MKSKIMTGYRGYAVAVVLGLCWGRVRAQQTVVLTLDECLAIALDKSYNIQTLKQDMLRAELNLRAAKAGYRTKLTSSFYAPAYDEQFKLIEVVGQNPVAVQYGSQQVSGTLTLTQPMPWLPFGGGDFSFSSNAYRLDSWTPDADQQDVKIKSAKFFTSLGLMVNKPLFAVNSVALFLKEAELNHELTSRMFKRNELDLVYNVTSGFFQLYRYTQQADINRESAQRQESIYTTTSNKYRAGLIAEVDAMQAEVDMIQAKNSLKMSEGQLAEQEAYFKQLIGMPMGARIRVITELELKQVAVDLERAKQLAIQNRSEIVEQKISIEEAKINIKQVDANWSIQGNLKGYYNYSQFSDPALSYDTPTEELFNSSWERLHKSPNRGFTFQLTVPLFDWGQNKAQVNMEKATLHKAELALDDWQVRVVREAEDAVRALNESYDRVQILAKSQEVSVKSMDISLKRYANGDITSTELARANDQLNSAKLSYLAAYIDYKLALADLKRKTLYDFEKNMPLVEEKKKK